MRGREDATSSVKVSVLEMVIPVAHLEHAGSTSQCVVGVVRRTGYEHLAEQLSLVN